MMWRFGIRRAGQRYDDKGPPCPEAILVSPPEDKYPEYEIELKDLQALVDFSERHGDLVFDTQKILIYDDYIE